MAYNIMSPTPYPIDLLAGTVGIPSCEGKDDISWQKTYHSSIDSQ